MIRLLAFAAALLLTTSACHEEKPVPREGVLASLPGCINGHPAHRRTDVTYGGLQPLHGYQRDHYVSLELLGPDTRANVHYQVLAFAHMKDGDEHRAGEWYCAQIMTLPQGRAWLAERWPLDAAHGYDRD